MLRPSGRSQVTRQSAPRDRKRRAACGAPAPFAASMAMRRPWRGRRPGSEAERWVEVAVSELRFFRRCFGGSGCRRGRRRTQWRRRGALGCRRGRQRTQRRSTRWRSIGWRRAESVFDRLLDGGVDLEAVGADQFDAVVRPGIVAGGDDDAAHRAQLGDQEGDRGGGHDAGGTHVRARGPGGRGQPAGDLLPAVAGVAAQDQERRRGRPQGRGHAEAREPVPDRLDGRSIQRRRAEDGTHAVRPEEAQRLSSSPGRSTRGRGGSPCGSRPSIIGTSTRTKVGNSTTTLSLSKRRRACSCTKPRPRPSMSIGPASAYPSLLISERAPRTVARSGTMRTLSWSTTKPPIGSPLHSATWTGTWTDTSSSRVRISRSGVSETTSMPSASSGSTTFSVVRMTSTSRGPPYVVPPNRFSPSGTWTRIRSRFRDSIASSLPRI